MAKKTYKTDIVWHTPQADGETRRTIETTSLKEAVREAARRKATYAQKPSPAAPRHFTDAKGIYALADVIGVLEKFNNAALAAEYKELPANTRFVVLPGDHFWRLRKTDRVYDAKGAQIWPWPHIEKKNKI